MRKEMKQRPDKADTGRAWSLKAFLIRVWLFAALCSIGMAQAAFASTLKDELEGDIEDIMTRVLGGLAAILIIGGLLQAAMAVKDMADDGGSPEQQEKGQRGLKRAIGAILAAVILLGLQATVVKYLQSALS